MKRRNYNKGFFTYHDKIDNFHIGLFICHDKYVKELYLFFCLGKHDFSIGYKYKSMN